MTFLDQVTVLILTYNEDTNIGRTLAAVARFSDIVVLDSGSTDETAAIVGRAGNARLERRPFDSHAAQWTHGLTACGITRPWVLALDADYVLSTDAVDEIAALRPAAEIAGYQIGFRYCMFGRPLSATLYPPVTALYRRDRARYVQDGHTQRVMIDGDIEKLDARIDHDDRKPLSRWIASQLNYARLEAAHLLAKPRDQLRRSDRIRLMAWPAPIVVFLYTLFVKRCILDGWPGWLYVLQRTFAETLIALELVDRRLRPVPGAAVTPPERARAAPSEPRADGAAP
jgi:glycosyltransferase involved in cell wall biosynthesis